MFVLMRACVCEREWLGADTGASMMCTCAVVCVCGHVRARACNFSVCVCTFVHVHVCSQPRHATRIGLLLGFGLEACRVFLVSVINFCKFISFCKISFRQTIVGV